MEQKINPLKGFFRQYKIYIRLPSGTSYYEPGVINFTESGEVGIMPMTGQDEIILKNPDALLNGEALCEVIRSCVPAVSDPRKLLTNDIDAIITAVRYATFNDSLETDVTCPACGHEGHYKIDLEYAINNMTYLEDQYIVHLDNGLSVFVKPYGYPEIMKGLHTEFERSKMIRSVEGNNMTEEQRLSMFSEAIRKMAEITFDLLASSIVKIVNEQHGVDVSDRSFILEFLKNADKKYIDQVSDMVKAINEIGVSKEFKSVCEKCNHNWLAPIDFNPVNFS
jgi:hypothetical protein